MRERREKRRATAATARAWLEVDLGALRRNAAALRARLAPRSRLLPMVKADGYGLGAARVAGALAGEGVWGFGVATVEEGAELRRAGIEDPIAVFTPCAPIDAERMQEWRLEPAATSLGALRAYARAADEGGAPLRAHLEVDTGMGRFGLPAERAGEWAGDVEALLEAGRLQLASTFTHFHSAESDEEATRAQWALFETAIEELRAAGVDPGLLHAANSAALLRHPETHADLVRPGLFLLGGEPLLGGEIGPPEPVARVRARVLDVRDVPEGAPVSYGATFRTRRPSRLATLGIGYADGLPHALSNRGEALLQGRRVRIVGAVCMDMTVVDVTEVDGIRPGSTATLLGRDAGAEITLAEVSELSGRIPYEVLTGFSSRVPRCTVTDEAGTGSERERIEAHGVEREQPA